MLGLELLRFLVTFSSGLQLDCLDFMVGFDSLGFNCLVFMFGNSFKSLPSFPTAVAASGIFGVVGSMLLLAKVCCGLVGTGTCMCCCSVFSRSFPAFSYKNKYPLRGTDVSWVLLSLHIIHFPLLLIAQV